MTKIYILIGKELTQINEKTPNGKMGKGGKIIYRRKVSELIQIVNIQSL